MIVPPMGGCELPITRSPRRGYKTPTLIAAVRRRPALPAAQGGTNLPCRPRLRGSKQHYRLEKDQLPRSSDPPKMAVRQLANKATATLMPYVNICLKWRLTTLVPQTLASQNHAAAGGVLAWAVKVLSGLE